eukprot:CAMPEP_0182429608 /NCGR_PEP_ID=MMETSP1167-20130531/31558_1 /TAXON_ID=2988 /ORGANISM="Mallomonas Sp, Strain CCMP3275" /LENGTH=217 /DNA_ID=CAMNT_0024613537 /DNA_START=124 /DNA_END=777 /DNA_ORIENTATION=+
MEKSGKKMSLSMAALVASILGIGIGLLGLNFYHATRCTGSQSSVEMETYITSIEKRLLQAESQNIRNAIVMDKLVRAVQSRLVKIESVELKKIMKSSEDQAVKIALELAGQPAPPMPEFEIEEKYKDAETLADIVDDVLSSSEGGIAYNEGSESENNKDKEYNDIPTVSDEVAKASCLEWKIKYEVITGVSWGKLPYDLQQKWMSYHCDQHVSDSSP